MEDNLDRLKSGEVNLMKECQSLHVSFKSVSDEIGQLQIAEREAVQSMENFQSRGENYIQKL